METSAKYAAELQGKHTEVCSMNYLLTQQFKDKECNKKGYIKKNLQIKAI